MNTKKYQLGPREYHPYEDFIPKNAKAMLIGSFPTSKFTTAKPNGKKLSPKDIDFFYGGSTNQLWQLITSNHQVDAYNVCELKNFLTIQKLAIGDVIKSCKRINNSSSDNHLREIEFNKDLKNKLKSANIKKLLFTSRKVEKWFASKIDNLNLYQWETLISPSAQASIWISTQPEYKKWRQQNPNVTSPTLLFRQMKYNQIFSKFLT